MSNFTTTTIELTLNRETRTVNARHFINHYGEEEWSIDTDLVAVRLGNGAKWHRPFYVVIQRCEFSGEMRVVNAPVLNKRASMVVWSDGLVEASKSQHVGSKIG